MVGVVPSVTVTDEEYGLRAAAWYVIVPLITPVVGLMLNPSGRLPEL